MFGLDLFDGAVTEKFKKFQLKEFNVSVLCVHEENCHIENFVSRVTWPSSYFLARYFASFSNRNIVEDKKILELGAGTGLTGLTLAKLGAGTVVLTDGCELSTSVLKKSVLENEVERICEVEVLKWNDNKDEEKMISKYGKFDIIVGADVVYEPESVEPLLKTAMKLLKQDHSKFYLANHKHRFDLLDNVFDEIIRKHGLKAVKIVTKLEMMMDGDDAIQFYIISRA